MKCPGTFVFETLVFFEKCFFDTLLCVRACLCIVYICPRRLLSLSQTSSSTIFCESTPCLHVLPSVHVTYVSAFRLLYPIRPKMKSVAHVLL